MEMSKEIAIAQANIVAPTVAAQIELVQVLCQLDGVYGRAVRAARAAGEDKIFAELEIRWSALEAYLKPILAAKPPKLLE